LKPAFAKDGTVTAGNARTKGNVQLLVLDAMAA
jgi:acetyl-CoA acetyltransferase